MDLNYKLYLERANNEIKFAEIALIVSDNKDSVENVFDFQKSWLGYQIIKGGFFN